MDTEIDWQRELDSSFGTGENHDVARYVASGHRAVRRRRTRAVVSGLAAAVVVAGVAWTIAPGGSPRSTDLPVATDPSGTSQTSGNRDPWGPGDPPARLGGGGAEIREGAVVHERRDDLYPAKDTDSVALDVSFGGERWWVSMEWDGSGGTSQSMQPEDGLFEDFDAFVRDRVRGGGMIVDRSQDDHALGGLVTWDGGEVHPEKGVVVVRVVPDPVPSEKDSIGLVLRKGDQTTWMLVTLDRYGSSASWDQASDSGWRTFDQWLADQVALEAGEPAQTLVELADDGTVTPALDGVEVLEQQADPDLRPYGTEADGAVSAVALVEWQGGRWFVLAIGGNGPDSVTAVAAEKAGGARTLEEFVAFMVDQADEGGMR